MHTVIKYISTRVKKIKNSMVLSSILSLFLSFNENEKLADNKKWE